MSDSSLFQLYDLIDRMMTAGEWRQLDDALAGHDFTSTDETMSLGLLCASFPGRDNLLSWKFAATRFERVFGYAPIKSDAREECKR